MLRCSSTTPSEKGPSLAHAAWTAEETWSQLAGDVNGQYGSFASLSGYRWTLRHQGQRSVCAPPKIPILGGRLPPYLPRCNSAHVGAKAAVFGGGDLALFAGVKRTEIASTFKTFYVWQWLKLTMKNMPRIMCLDLLLETLTTSIQFAHRSGHMWGIMQNLSHWGKTICSPSIQCLDLWASTVFQLYIYVYSYVSPHASFEMCVDMWTLEGLDKAQNGRACFHL